MDELIQYAIRRLNESCEADKDMDIQYWRAYLDGATAMKKEYERRTEDDRK